MSRFGAKKGRKLPGAEFTWETDPNGEPDTAPTPLFPKYTVPRARPLSTREQLQVDLYRQLRERFHDGKYYSVLKADPSSSNRSAAARAQFDPFHGMPSYSGKYQKKKRDAPFLRGRPYVMKFFPRNDLWQTIQPSYKPGTAMDGYVPQGTFVGVKRGFEVDEDEEEDAKRQKGEDDDGEGDAANNDLLEGEEEGEEEIVDDNFEDDDDEMGGDYNAEQYFDGGEDDFSDGGGGGDEDTY